MSTRRPRQKLSPAHGAPAHGVSVDLWIYGITLRGMPPVVHSGASSEFINLPAEAMSIEETRTPVEMHKQCQPHTVGMSLSTTSSSWPKRARQVAITGRDGVPSQPDVVTRFTRTEPRRGRCAYVYTHYAKATV